MYPVSPVPPFPPGLGGEVGDHEVRAAVAVGVQHLHARVGQRHRWCLAQGAGQLEPAAAGVAPVPAGLRPQFQDVG